MDPTSIAEQFKRWSEDFFKRFQTIEEENKSLKLKIVELETKEKIGNDDEEIKNLKLKIIELTQELEKKTHEKSRISGSVMPMSSGSANSLLDEIKVKEEPDDEFIPEDLPLDTQSLDEDSIDIKEEDIGYGQSNERSIQTKLDSAKHVANTEPGSGETDRDLKHNSSPSYSYSTKNLLCSKSVEPEQPVYSQGSCEQKKKQPLTTRPTEKIQCEKCSSAFDTRYKLMKHNESGKCKAPFNCPRCVKSFGTIRVFTNHLKTHTGEKKKQSMSVRIDKELGTNPKRSLTLEDKKVNSEALPEKKRKVACETEVRNDEEMPPVRDGINSPSVVEVERNPLKIKEFLERILSNLGKKDLLNARLVSRVWNKESLEILGKSKFTQILRDWKMERYTIFAKPNEPHQLILPFHLDFRISSSPMYLARYNRILTTYVERLTQMFGSECVSTFTLTTDDTNWTEENIQEIGLTKCLEKISPGLKTLDLTSFKLRIEFLQNQTISFPNLKKLICSEFESGRRGPGLTYKTVIENSPNIEDLTLTDPRDLDSWPLKFNQLKSLYLPQMFRPQNILDILSRSGPSVLRELRFGYGEYWSAEDKTVVYNIVKSVSTTLKSLIFHGHKWFMSTGNMSYMRFHKLPELEHFGQEYETGNTIQLAAENLDFSPENFPSLKSIELPLGFIFTPSLVQSEDDDEARVEFSNFTKLILRVSAKAGPEHVDRPLEQLQQIFPNPSRLCLLNVGGHGFVKYVLYRIVKSNWYKSIQQIEMIGFFKHYLKEIVGGFSLSPRVDSNKWYSMLEDSMKTEYQNTMNRIRMVFEVTVVDDDSIVLRTKQSI